MHVGKTLFAQVMDHVPLYEFRKCVSRYRGNYKIKRFTCWEQFLCMAFAQLSYRESLRDIEACLRAMPDKLYHMGIRSQVSRNTLAHANETRDWRIYADFGQSLIQEARKLYLNEPFGVDLEQTVYALDATIIDLCLSVFPWAHYQRRKGKGGVKLHTLLDLRGNLPCMVTITTAKFFEVKTLDDLLPEPGAIYLLDRAYLDFSRLFILTQSAAWFVIRARSNTKLRRLYSHPVDKSTGVIRDQTIVLTGAYTPQTYPDKLRLIKYCDQKTNKRYTFLTNNFTLPASVVADLYRCRWQVELFFKWIKQHLRIQAFYGTSENAVKTQIWIAISVYLLVAIIKKRLQLKASLYTILQILSVSLFEKTPIYQALSGISTLEERLQDANQLILFN